ncbi:MAG: cold shock domain-containing protein [Dongiaceae bacterium]
MGKTRDFRGPRRRAFDDDMFSPSDVRGAPRAPRHPGGGGFDRPPPAMDGPLVDASVKWFNAEKGFGFAALGDGSGDVFLHIGVLQAAGRESVAPGTKLKVSVGQGTKGRQITRVAEIDDSTATEPPRRSSSGGPSGGARPQRFTPDPSTAVEVVGTVKWFNGDKGFGFVTGDDGGKDVFVHVSVLERSRLPPLNEGQRVAMRVVETPKGREAIAVNLAS